LKSRTVLRGGGKEGSHLTSTGEEGALLGGKGKGETHVPTVQLPLGRKEKRKKTLPDLREGDVV